MRPAAHSLVSGLCEPPYAGDSNPQPTKFAGKDALLQSLQPTEAHREGSNVQVSLTGQCTRQDVSVIAMTDNTEGNTKDIIQRHPKEIFHGTVL